jgi:DNA-binding NtrC family response regulator
MKILIVDDEQMALTSVKRILKHRGIRNVEICDNGHDAIKSIESNDYDVVLLDLLMPEIDGLQVLESTKPFKPQTEFILLTAVDDINNAVKAIRLGAYDYLVKPVDNERLFLSIEHAYERQAMRAGLMGKPRNLQKTTASEAFSAIIGQSFRMQELFYYAEKMAKTDSPVLITGESGTGKELMARAIHQASNCADGPFIPVNVCSVAESMFESQFFGYKQGAFTGATTNFPGFFEQANGGTLFLDEIGDLPLHLQAKFLRVLEEKTIYRLGDPKPIKVNVRILSATNTDLDQACQQGKFRLDLMYRLKAAHIHLPPLHERAMDIPLLSAHFLKQSNLKHKKNIHNFTPETMELLNNKKFPGNIRELAQLIDSAVLHSDTDYILPRDIGGDAVPLSPFSREQCSLKENADKHILYILSETHGDRKQAADILGVTVRQVQRKLAEMKKNPQLHDLISDI